jgi:hypothetical protein
MDKSPSRRRRKNEVVSYPFGYAAVIKTSHAPVDKCPRTAPSSFGVLAVKKSKNPGSPGQNRSRVGRSSLLESARMLPTSLEVAFVR